MYRKHIYDFIRAAVFILLPVFIYMRPLLPAPMKVQSLYFVLAVILAEIGRRIFAGTPRVRWAYALPLLAALASIYPYLSQLAYFDSLHRLLIGLLILLGLLYWAEGRLVSGNRGIKT